MGEKVVATGGGFEDNSVKFWDLSTGELLLNHDTGSQVTDINFDGYYREMTTCHAVPQSMITTWKYSKKGMQDPEFTAVNKLEQTSRVLYMSQSPCGAYIIIKTEEDCGNLLVFDNEFADLLNFDTLFPTNKYGFSVPV
uniref:Uncharacterized protein n=1 Tax=Panagrolaimus sp. JU765 TaxID=591449 RepID=A0AC34Q9C7_9BILA